MYRVQEEYRSETKIKGGIRSGMSDLYLKLNYLMWPELRPNRVSSCPGRGQIAKLSKYARIRCAQRRV